MRFFFGGGGCESGFLNPKTDFAFFVFFTKTQKRITNSKNPHSEWILQIKYKSRFLRFMVQAFFLGGGGGGGGGGPTIVHLSSGLPIFSLDLAWQNIRSWKIRVRNLRSSTRQRGPELNTDDQIAEHGCPLDDHNSSSQTKKI